MMGVSRDTFYRYQSARDEGGVEALLEKTPRKPNPKNRVEPQVEQAVLDVAVLTEAQVNHCEWEFGRVAGRYRRLFDELPLETLRAERR